MTGTIVIAEDDAGIRTMLRYYFQSAGYTVRDYPSGEELLAAQTAEDIPLLFILDIMLPGMDGISLLKQLRALPETSDIPIIFLTARTSEADRVTGLEAGADDYVVKPFGILELQARVKAVLRRTRRDPSPELLRLGELELNLPAHEVRRNGELLELTYKEFELLRLLVSKRGQVLTRDEILRSVWDYDYTGETRTVDMHIKTLRQKLGVDLIQTVRGVGYKITP